MTSRSKIPFPQTLFNYIDSLFSGPNRVFKITLTISLMLHATIFLPPHLFKPRKRPMLNENLLEINLNTSSLKPKNGASKPEKATAKPKLKRKRKLKIKQKPPLKKSKNVAKESSLARRKTIPKKKNPATSNKLDEIKNRLARQREEDKLNAIRQRIRNSTSPATRAQQASLTQAYNQILTVWIMHNWHLPEHLLNSGLEATISLTIAASGRLLNQNEEQLSGNTIFDHAMRQAIVNANPFPPFPTELTITQEEFVITFNPNNISKEN